MARGTETYVHWSEQMYSFGQSTFAISNTAQAACNSIIAVIAHPEEKRGEGGGHKHVSHILKHTAKNYTHTHTLQIPPFHH